MLKKILVIFCLIIGASLFWCATNKNTPDKVVLQFASWGSESEINILKPIINDFEAKNPDIKIEFMHIPQNYFQKIHLLYASNTAPDIVFINNQYLPVYANAGVLEDLTPYSRDFEFSKYYKKSIDAMTWKNKIYAVPRDVSNLMVFYNKNLFDKYGENYPRKGWNFNDFLKTAQNLTNKTTFGVSFEDDPLFFLPYLTSEGGWTKYDTENYFSKDVLNSRENKDGLNFYASLRKKYHVAPRKEEAGSATMAQMFLQERIGMYISGRWMVPKLRQDAKFDWDIVEFPQGKAGSIVPLDASGWAISKSSKNKEQAIKFVKYLASEENSAKFTQSGLIVPAREGVSRSGAFLDDKKPKNAQVFLDVIYSSVPTPVTLNYREILDDLKVKTEYLFN